MYAPGYSFNGGTGGIFAFNATTNSLTTLIDVGGAPQTPTFDPVNDDLYVSDQDTNTISVIAAGPLSSGGSGSPESGGSSSFLGLPGDDGYFLVSRPPRPDRGRSPRGRQAPKAWTPGRFHYGSAAPAGCRRSRTPSRGWVSPPAPPWKLAPTAAPSSQRMDPSPAASPLGRESEPASGSIGSATGDPFPVRTCVNRQLGREEPAPLNLALGRPPSSARRALPWFIVQEPR